MLKALLVGLVALLLAFPVMAQLPDGEADAEEIEEAVVIEDPDADDWFGTLTARAGYLYDSDAVEGEEMKQTLMAPLLGWKKFALEVGLSEGAIGYGALTYDVGSLADLGIENFLGDMVNVHVGVWVGNRLDTKVDEESITWGVVVTLLTFDANESGNARKQAARER